MPSFGSLEVTGRSFRTHELAIVHNTVTCLPIRLGDTLGVDNRPMQASMLAEELHELTHTAVWTPPDARAWWRQHLPDRNDSTEDLRDYSGATETLIQPERPE